MKKLLILFIAILFVSCANKYDGSYSAGNGNITLNDGKFRYTIPGGKHNNSEYREGTYKLDVVTFLPQGCNPNIKIGDDFITFNYYNSSYMGPTIFLITENGIYDQLGYTWVLHQN